MKKALEILTSYGNLIADKTPISSKEIEEAIEELKIQINKSCESCKHCQILDRKGEKYIRCSYLGTVGDIGFCGRWESKW